MSDSIIEIGNLVKTGNWSSPQRGRVYATNGVAPSLYCFSNGGNLQPKIVEVYEDTMGCDNREPMNLEIYEKQEA